MRIIAGSARGINLKTLEGLNTRPTTGRVKESLFSAIQFDISGKQVLDLFAGSGQLGLEALSRGAVNAVFVDSSSEAISIIRENVKHAGFTEESQIMQSDYLSFLQKCKKQFNLIFLDPPYAGNQLNNAIEKICGFDILSPCGIIVAETQKGNPVIIPGNRKYAVRTYGFGISQVSVIRFDIQE